MEDKKDTKGSQVIVEQFIKWLKFSVVDDFRNWRHNFYRNSVACDDMLTSMRGVSCEVQFDLA